MKKNLLNLVIILITAIALVILVCSTSGSQMSNILSSMKANWILGAVLCMVIYWLMEAVILHVVSMIHLGKNRFYNSLRFSMMGLFFNAVTPFSSGGQPLQAFCMIKNGIKPGHTVSILVVRSMMFQFVMFVYSIVVFIFKAPYFIEKIDRFLIFFIFGVLVNFLMLLLYVLFMFNKSAAENVVQFIFRFLKKIRLIKKPEKYVLKIEIELESFCEGVNACKGRLPEIFKVFILQLVQFTVFFAIPYCIYKAIESGPGEFFNMISANAILTMVTFLVPSPGASGGAEGFTYLFFNHFFTEGNIAPVILIFRTITYYFNIFIGGLVSALSPEKPFKNNPSEAFPIKEESM